MTQRMFTATICALLFTGYASAEKLIHKADMPQAVRKTADAQRQGAVVRGYSKDSENGEVEYEEELLVNGHTKDITMDARGNVMEVEEEVALSSLPQSVQSALKNRAPQGQIRKVESLTKGGKLVAYEAQVYTNGKHSEIQVGPNGERLAHEE